MFKTSLSKGTIFSNESKSLQRHHPVTNLSRSMKDPRTLVTSSACEAVVETSSPHFIPIVKFPCRPLQIV